MCVLVCFCGIVFISSSLELKSELIRSIEDATGSSATDL